MNGLTRARASAILFIAVSCVGFVWGAGRASQPVFTPPKAPWKESRATVNDPDLGPSYMAYVLQSPGHGAQRLMAYRLFTVPIHADLGDLSESFLKEYYPDASFTTPQKIELCGGIKAWSFTYTADLNHDGHRTLTREIVTQGTAMYAIAYRRPVDRADDEQAVRAMDSFCPPKVEALPTALPFVITAEFAAYAPPPSFQFMPGQNTNSIEWIQQVSAGASVIALRHQATLFSSIAQFGAEQQRLAADGADALDGFRNYKLVENHGRQTCQSHPVQAWYTKISGNYFGTPAIAEQVAFLQNGVLHSAAYLRPDAVLEDLSALRSLQSLCPRESWAPPVALRYKGIAGAEAALVVNGTSFTTQEGNALNGFVIMSVSRKTQAIWKSANEMPKYAPDVAYAGKNGAGDAVIWKRGGLDADPKTMSDAVQAEMNRESLIAAIAGALGAGQGGPKLQALVHSHAPERLTALAADIMDAFQRVSDQTVANSLATQRWIADHVTSGMGRRQVVAMLTTRGIQSTSLVRSSPCTDSSIVSRWWYQGTYPESECAAPDTTSHPVISVNLAGASEPGCSFSQYLDVLFDDHDRVQRLVLGNPIPDCL